jgi:shikimate kinase
LTKNKLVLLGYMASGKTSVAKLIAKKSNLKYIDLDAYISSNEEMSVPDIFKNKGEIYFRKIESRYLKDILMQKSACVLALGGGTPCYGQNMELINKYATSIFLNVSLSILVLRLKSEKKSRPLVANIDDRDLNEFVAKHLFERLPFYEKAQHLIDATNKNTEAIAVEILKLNS